MCSGGQLSNRLACIRQNRLDAAIMNRTLILPTTGIDYNYHNLLGGWGDGGLGVGGMEEERVGERGPGKSNRDWDTRFRVLRLLVGG